MFFSAKLLWLLIHWSSQGVEAGHLGGSSSNLIDKQGERNYKYVSRETGELAAAV